LSRFMENSPLQFFCTPLKTKQKSKSEVLFRVLEAQSLPFAGTPTTKSPIND
jgi:hypothetical protein